LKHEVLGALETLTKCGWVAVCVAVCVAELDCQFGFLFYPLGGLFMRHLIYGPMGFVGQLGVEFQLNLEFRGRKSWECESCEGYKYGGVCELELQVSN
jgi:hypothetical protein